VQVKLTGDGTKICRKLNLINFCFNESDLAKSARGNHAIAIINSSENYDDLKVALTDIRNEVESLTSIIVDGMKFPIEYFLCGDLKFLALICGIENATCTHACIWCKCPADKQHDMHFEWSFRGTKAWTISDIQACCTQPKIKNFNCAHIPLFPTIPIHHTVVDMLHLFLRITDILFNLLVLDIRRKDTILKFTSKSCLIANNLQKLQSFLNDDCHIPFKFYYYSEAKDLKWRDFMGPEKLVVFSKIYLPKLLPDLPNINVVQLLWKKLKSLYDVLHSERISFSNAVKFEEDAKQWINDFAKIYQTKHVTLYMHILVMHLGEFLQRYRNLVTFTQQGIEKLNDMTTIAFARSTNHNYRNLDALKQLMQKKNRSEHLEEENCQCKPRSYRCKNCNETGHNKKTCKKPVTKETITL